MTKLKQQPIERKPLTKGKAAEELSWPTIKVIKVASANPRIHIPHGSMGATNQVLDLAGEPEISESIDFPTSAESILLKNVTGLAIEGRQEILIDRVAERAFADWLNLPGELQTMDALIEFCIAFINRKTLHELSHALGKCNEAHARDVETIIPAKIGNVTYEKPDLLVIDLTA